MYENIFIYKEDSIVNKPIWALQNTGVGQDYPELQPSGKYASVLIGIPFGTKAVFTGRYLLNQNMTDTCYQVFISNFYGNSIYGYVWHSDLGSWSNKELVSDKNSILAQNFVNELINYNKSILEYNLLCARGLELSKQIGVALPNDFRGKLYGLQLRLQKRDEAIEQSGYVTAIQRGTSPDFSVYKNALNTFMANPGIGLVITTTTAIIIGCIILATGAVAAYALFKKLHAESKADFQLSADLTADLMKYLPKETFNQLMAENKANARKAQEAIDNASGKSMFTTLKYLAVGFAGFYVVDNFLVNRNKK